MCTFILCAGMFIEFIVLTNVSGGGTGDYRNLEPDRAGAVAVDGCMWVGGMGGRVVPSSGNADGYTRWHRDKPSSHAAENPSYRHVKVFTNLWDVPIGGGATSYVPGTHRLPLGPEGHLERGLFKRAGSEDGLLDQRLMPNLVEAALPAGSAIAFDSAGWHTSMPNVSGQARRSCYSLYRSSETRGSLTEVKTQTQSNSAHNPQKTFRGFARF